MGTGGEDQRGRLIEALELMRVRADKARSWRDAYRTFGALVNREGYVPISTRLGLLELSFLARARDDVLAFARLGLRIAELHRPREADGVTSDPSSPILRCRSCMVRWPCSTYRAVADAVAGGQDATGDRWPEET